MVLLLNNNKLVTVYSYVMLQCPHNISYGTRSRQSIPDMDSRYAPAISSGLEVPGTLSNLSWVIKYRQTKKVSRRLSSVVGRKCGQKVCRFPWPSPSSLKHVYSS